MKRYVWVVVGVLLFFGLFGIIHQPAKKTDTIAAAPVQTDKPQIVSVKPDLKNSPIILPNQVIEITFNIELENSGEFKNKIDTFKDYAVKLSDDRKTAIISPTKSYDLGKSYTLFISKDSKFIGGKRLDNDEHFEFRTIDYHGV